MQRHHIQRGRRGSVTSTRKAAPPAPPPLPHLNSMSPAATEVPCSGSPVCQVTTWGREGAVQGSHVEFGRMHSFC